MIITTNDPKDLYEDTYSIKIQTNEGESEVNIGKGKSEDMCLARDLQSIFNVSDMLMLAYNAGKNGEEITTIIDNEKE